MEELNKLQERGKERVVEMLTRRKRDGFNALEEAEIAAIAGKCAAIVREMIGDATLILNEKARKAALEGETFVPKDPRREP